MACTAFPVTVMHWETRLRASIKLMEKEGNGAKIIWASSTPLKNAELTVKAKELNTIAARVMKEEGIPTNDLFALMDPLDRNVYWSDTYHYKGAGMKKTRSRCDQQRQPGAGSEKSIRQPGCGRP